MPIFDTFKQASFGGLNFPIDSCKVNGGIRDHIHEYPHADGGTPEKMGRKLYEIRMSGLFQNTFKAYPNLYPTTLNSLRDMWENETTADLVIPTLGTMKCYARAWSHDATAKVRSGERVDMVFIEDQQPDGLVAFIANTAGPNGLGGNVANYISVLAGYPDAPSDFQLLIGLVNAALIAKDQADLQLLILQAKILQITSLCATLDRNFFLQDPLKWPLAQSMRDIWLTAQSSLLDLQQQFTTLQTYVTPNRCSVADIARALYKDASRSTDILQLNPIEDAFAVPPGFRIRYYPGPAS